MDKKARTIINTDNYLIVSKDSGRLVQGNDSEEKSLLDDIKEEENLADLHLLTRLDRPVSGLVLLSKNKSFNKHYLEEQERNNVTKEYLAIVEGHFSEDEMILQHFHRQDSKNKKARIESKFTKGYKKILLECHCLKKLERYSILRLVLKRGKFHQIRAQLSFIGFPIKGDVKYGARRKNADRSIYLHAHKITFKDLDNKLKEYNVIPSTDDKLWRLLDQIEE